MCGRYAQSVSTEGIEEIFDIRLPTHVPWEPSYNVAPTQKAPVVALDPKGVRALRLHRWGLVPRWAKDPSIGAQAINARSDTLAEKPMFRAAFKSRRCLVPATGFYEWRKTPEGKVPMFIHPVRAPIFAFAGLWEAWTPPDGGEALRTFTIITVDSNELLSAIHDRMPVILPHAAWKTWLDPETSPADLLEMLAAYPASRMRAHAVSTLVNSPSHDGPELIEPVRVSSAA
ncbi:MAG: SOS response-associated peptidase [Deltaproteobacteria bacterium]|nr:SOS response-associated peptidase [Deltaproteobacteria bacterium]